MVSYYGNRQLTIINTHMKKVILFLPLIALVLTGYSCQTSPAKVNQNTNQDQTNMANPASVYCEQQGGKLEIRTAADGSQSGTCVFADNSECDEWAYFRHECSPQSQTEDISDEIKQLFIQKYNKAEDEVTVTVNQQTADYARGGVKFGKNGIGEGGIFLAAKVDGVWRLVFDGNGIYRCSQLKPYNFPESMAPDCLE